MLRGSLGRTELNEVLTEKQERELSDEESDLEGAEIAEGVEVSSR